jgi:hypothetical protein
MAGTLVTRSLRIWPKDEDTKSRSLNRVDRFPIHLVLIPPSILLPISTTMATPEIFPTCYHMDHRTIPIGVTCYFCKSPSYRDTADEPLTLAESVTPTPPGLSEPSAPPPHIRLPHRPSIMIPNAATASHPPTFGLAGRQIRRTAFPRQRDQFPPRIQSSTPTSVTAAPPPPPAEIKYLFAVAIAIGHWPLAL